ncbi:MAG: DUF4126 domain-containing protein [Gammaproteobacteria bacterium]|nr:DUF4126 domain-containing protein [Gammaproteobacteria bacterium]
MDLTQTIALTMGVAWASGINLYAAILMLGLMGATGHIVLPPGLESLTNPMVIGAAGFMYCVEFFADKVPGVDNGWDTLHTFVRIPAGAVLAAGAVGPVSMEAQIAAALIGGSLAAATHATKAGGRLILNTSPEPVTNWTASLCEDIAVIAGLWAALNYPVVFLVLLGVFVLLMIWLLPKIWRGVVAIFRTIGKWLGLHDGSPSMVAEATVPAAKDDTAPVAGEPGKQV